MNEMSDSDEEIPQKTTEFIKIKNNLNYEK